MEARELGRATGSVSRMAPKLVVVGGGKMGSALLAGLIDGGWAPVADLAVSEPDEAQRRPPGRGPPRPAGLRRAGRCRVAVLAVKPDVAEAVARTLGAVGVTRVLSIVAGLSTARLEDALPPGAVVVRAMPNTPALVGAGVAAMSGGSGPPPPTSTGPRASSARWDRWSACPSASSTR